MVAPTLRRIRSPWTQTVDLGDELRTVWSWLRRPRLLRRLLPELRQHLSEAPASTAYAFTLFVTWWTLRGVGDSVERRLIFSASTNLYNMQHNPVQVLVASAFWTQGQFPWVTIAEILVVMGFAERWLGTGRWILLFATGHIGATLLTVTAIGHAIDRHVIPVRVQYAADVGTSYGFTAVLAAMAFHFRGVARVLWAGVIVAVLTSALLIGPTFTDYGHMCAALIGLLVGFIASIFWRRIERLRAEREATSGAPTPVSATNPLAAHRIPVAGDAAGPSSATAPPLSGADSGSGVAAHHADERFDGAGRDRAEHRHQ
ncbi:rhomboid-like protein [Nocardia sp. NPDC051990]|uniref:rhomboid-like protein n=1 Tax=Nocardia sp. NPDC051990 TaxID=3155285 RepID=UPI003439B8B4